MKLTFRYFISTSRQREIWFSENLQEARRKSREKGTANSLVENWMQQRGRKGACIDIYYGFFTFLGDRVAEKQSHATRRGTGTSFDSLWRVLICSPVMYDRSLGEKSTERHS